MSTFCGQDLTYEECEKLYQQLDAKHRKSLDMYYDNRWFDYYRDHPIHSVYRYVGAYNDCIKVATAKYIDYRLAESAKGVGEQDVLKCSKFTLNGIIRGLCFANHFGLPYKTYINLGIENYMGFRSQRCLPRPADLYNKFFILKVMEYKKDINRHVLFASDDFYQVDQYKGLPLQHRYYRYLVQELLTTKEGRAMVTSGFHEKYLPIEYRLLLLDKMSSA